MLTSLNCATYYSSIDLRMILCPIILHSIGALATKRQNLMMRNKIDVRYKFKMDWYLLPGNLLVHIVKQVLDDEYQFLCCLCFHRCAVQLPSCHFVYQNTLRRLCVEKRNNLWRNAHTDNEKKRKKSIEHRPPNPDHYTTNNSFLCIGLNVTYSHNMLYKHIVMIRTMCNDW